MSLRGILALLTFSTVLFTSVLAAAASQTITASHTYVMGDNDSKNDGRRICFLEAKRKVLEKAGTFIESATEIKNFQLSKDQISSYTAAVLSVETVKEDFATRNGQSTVTMTVKANVDTADVQKRLANIVADKGLQEKITAQQKQLRQLEEQMRTLNTKLGTPSAESSVYIIGSPSMSSKLNEWLDRARPLNPGVPDEELTDYWNKTYGLRKERKQVLSDIQDLENKKLVAVKRITEKTDIIRKYIVRNMTMQEVRGILGKPRTESDSYPVRSWNYGELWVCFSDGLVLGIGPDRYCLSNELK